MSTDLLVIMPSGWSWIPTPPATQTPRSAMCCPSYGSPNRTSTATERVGMGAGPIRGRNTRHKRLLSDQRSRVEPSVVFQLSYRRFPVCQLEERRRELSACWEDCCFLLHWTRITRKYNNGSCLFLVPFASVWRCRSSPGGQKTSANGQLCEQAINCVWSAGKDP